MPTAQHSIICYEAAQRITFRKSRLKKQANEYGMIPNEVEVSGECNRKYQTGKQYLNFTLFFWLFSLYVKKNIIIKPARANSILAISSSRAVHVTFQAGEGAKKSEKETNIFTHGDDTRKIIAKLSAF